MRVIQPEHLLFLFGLLFVCISECLCTQVSVVVVFPDQAKNTMTIYKQSQSYVLGFCPEQFFLALYRTYVLFCFSVEVAESFYNGLCPDATTTALTSVLSCDCMEGHSASCSATANIAGCESSTDGGKTAKRMKLIR